MRALFVMIFAIGMALVCVPTWHIMNAPSLDDMKRERLAIAAWPSTSGWLDEIHIKREMAVPKGMAWYQATVLYHYTVAGLSFTGTRVGIQPYRDTSTVELEGRMSAFVSAAHVEKREEAKDESGDLSFTLTEQPVKIYYNPAVPSQSMLDTQDYDPPTWKDGWAPYMVPIPFGLGLMVLGLIKLRAPKPVDASMILAGSDRVKPLAELYRTTYTPTQSNILGTRKSTPADWLQEGDELLKQGIYAEALSSYERALSLIVEEPGTLVTEIGMLLGKGECLIALERFSEAKRTLEDALGLTHGILGGEALAARARRLLEQAAPSPETGKESGISPWSHSAILMCPNGKITASILEAHEFAANAPTSGTLTLTNGLTYHTCNPSMMWSTDSEYLAVPQWTPAGRQRLMVIWVTHGVARYAPGEYRVLQLQSFENGIIRGVDSQRHLPKQVQVSIHRIIWDEV